MGLTLRDIYGEQAAVQTRRHEQALEAFSLVKKTRKP